jgi:stage IV sporulation protein FB
VFLAEPPSTAYDLRFHVGPVPVRISPFFWVAAGLIGWSLAHDIDQQVTGSPGAGVWLLLWIAAVLISILVHEIGHWLAMRWYGTDAYVVLYHFGGLAVPRGSSFGGYGADDTRGNQLVISAAGPVAQLLLAAALIFGVQALGYQPPPIPYLDPLLNLGRGEVIPSDTVNVFLWFLALPSIYWALLNLLPVYPLDGGHITREIFLRLDSQSGIRNSLMLSVFTAGLIAFLAFVRLKDPFLGIMFALLAFSSFQTLQRYTGGGFGGSRW